MWTTLASNLLSSTQNNVQQIDTSKLLINDTQNKESNTQQTYILAGAGVAGLGVLLFIIYKIATSK